MGLNNDLIREFKTITRYDLQDYLLQFEDLGKNHFGKILQYYSGKNAVIPSKSVTLLRKMVDESERLDYIIGLNVARMGRTDFWDLLEIIEEIKTKLHTMLNADRWSRASVVLSKKVQNPHITVQLKQNETIERMAGTSLGSSNEQQDWYKIAIDNDLQEEAYTPEGGTVLQVSASGGRAFQILSIVDIMDKERMKGKDPHRKITWVDDDINVLSGDECFIQCVEILMGLRKGQNPEFPSEGLTADLAVGQNINSIAFPLLTRQISETLNTDDAISTFSIDQLRRDQDGLFMDLTIISKSYEEYKIDSSF